MLFDRNQLSAFGRRITRIPSPFLLLIICNNKTRNIFHTYINTTQILGSIVVVAHVLLSAAIVTLLPETCNIHDHHEPWEFSNQSKLKRTDHLGIRTSSVLLMREWNNHKNTMFFAPNMQHVHGSSQCHQNMWTESLFLSKSYTIATYIKKKKKYTIAT